MKFKKIYEEFSYGKELKGYECEKAYIEIYCYDITKNGNFHKDYIVDKLKEKGYPSRFSTLKEAKSFIERCL